MTGVSQGTLFLRTISHASCNVNVCPSNVGFVIGSGLNAMTLTLHASTLTVIRFAP
jgi:hypothetical protein